MATDSTMNAGSGSSHARSKHLGILTVLIFSFGGPWLRAFAQAPSPAADAAGTPRFDVEVVVTPERAETPRALVPAATVLIDATTLASLPAAHPSEIVSFLPGFSVARPQFYAGRPVVSARGFFGGGEADYIRLLVDGVPVSD